MSEALTEVADEHVRAAERYAAELIDKLGTPAIYEEAVTLASVAYLEGQIAQLKAARNTARGDEPEYRDYLRSLPTPGGAA